MILEWLAIVTGFGVIACLAAGISTVAKRLGRKP